MPRRLLQIERAPTADDPSYIVLISDGAHYIRACLTNAAFQTFQKDFGGRPIGTMRNTVLILKDFVVQPTPTFDELRIKIAMFVLVGGQNFPLVGEPLFVGEVDDVKAILAELKCG